MDDLTEKKIGSEEKYRGGIITVRVDRVEVPGGKKSSREVVEHPGAVAVLAGQKDKLILVRQYRHPVEEALWELPAGKLEKGEPPEECARREMEEETGFRPGELELLTSFYTSPGFCSEIIYLYRASRLEKVGEPVGDGEENLRLGYFSREEALEKAREGGIKDAKTLIGLLWGN